MTFCSRFECQRRQGEHSTNVINLTRGTVFLIWARQRSDRSSDLSPRGLCIGGLLWLALTTKQTAWRNLNKIMSGLLNLCCSGFLHTTVNFTEPPRNLHFIWWNWILVCPHCSFSFCFSHNTIAFLKLLWLGFTLPFDVEHICHLYFSMSLFVPNVFDPSHN